MEMPSLGSSPEIANEKGAELDPVIAEFGFVDISPIGEILSVEAQQYLMMIGKVSSIETIEVREVEPTQTELELKAESERQRRITEVVGEITTSSHVQSQRTARIKAERIVGTVGIEDVADNS